mmetsp:Transcript_21899/g.33167  ORF Transcript_21899/g.33167 Transcript_21899/m.33167 type:complete len:247 (+) Transcript_21899:179-919(+)
MVRRLLNKDDDTLGSVCDKCCNWCYDDRKGWEGAWPVHDSYPDQPLDQELMDAVGVSYPKNREIPIGTYIKPMKQTFPWLLSGVKLAILALATRLWKKGEFDAYLSTFAVSDKIVITRAKAYADSLYDEIVKPLKQQRGEWALRLKPKLATESLLECGIIPFVWVNESISIPQFVELPMHQLFLGTVKTIYDVMDEFIKGNKHGESFAAFINPYISEIRRCGLSWCAIREFDLGLADPSRGHRLSH